MKTKIITLIILLTGICVFVACNKKSASEAAREVAEEYIRELTEQNIDLAIKHCGGELKESHEGIIKLSELYGEDFFKIYEGANLKVTYCELVPGFQDIAIAVVTSTDTGGKLSYIMHLRNSGKWKMMHQEEGDITPYQKFITSEMLEQYGIYTVSDKDVEEAKEFLGW